jgi:hypothetical protein
MNIKYLALNFQHNTINNLIEIEIDICKSNKKKLNINNDK